MMQQQTTWTLFNIGGIPIRVNISVLLLVLYFLWSTWPHFTHGIAGVAVLLISILLHELSHAGIAIVFGGAVHDIVLQLCGGCARIVRMPRKIWQEALMAIAGPLCSIVLAIVLGFLAYVPFAHEAQAYYGSVIRSPNELLMMAAGMNFMLGLFNLIPAFPMDGGRVLRALLQLFGKTRLTATAISVRIGQGFAVLWALVSIYSFFSSEPLIAIPANWPFIVQLIVSLLTGGSGGFLLLAVAYMIWMSGQQELAYVRYESSYYGDR